MKFRILFLYPFFFLLCAAAVFPDQLYKSNVTASYYADKFNGRMTSNGERFNMNALTAAHKTLPFNTVVKVTNLGNGKSVTVRINDRGPFVAGREIDVSKAAAVTLGLMQTGTAKVSLTIVNGSASTSENVDDMQWDIQIGAYTVPENADNMAQRLLKAGFTNVVYQKKGRIIRIALSSIRTGKVQAYLDTLESKGFTDYYVHKRI